MQSDFQPYSFTVSSPEIEFVLKNAITQFYQNQLNSLVNLMDSAKLEAAKKVEEVKKEGGQKKSKGNEIKNAAKN